ncbi:MAG TPA: hypothetical protein VMU84_19040, partial [Thermoanaerobaculia bacterium]|nr:hypothetical protein [Thermoanaerobaculia bacterium]
MAESQHERFVFLNCPLDAEYRPLFEAIVFAVQDCGYVVKCALEFEDGSEIRIEKISRLIASCRLGIHDISRTELDIDTELPRFNMPFELGLFFGAKRFGRGIQKLKNCLILDTERYRYQKFISDIAGQDIAAHRRRPDEAIAVVRNWLSNLTPRSIAIPSGAVIEERYASFRIELPALCTQLHLRPN